MRSNVVRLGQRPRPTRRGRVLALLLLVIAVEQLLMPHWVWRFLLYTFGVVFALAFAWAMSLARTIVVARRTEQTVAQVGDQVVEEFLIANRGLFPALVLRIDDLSTLPEHRAQQLVSCGGQAERSWRVSTVCRRRGLYVLGPWSVSSGDPFGLFSVEGRAGVVAQVLVYPPIGELPAQVQVRGDLTGGRARSERSLMREAVAGGVRPHVPGDPLASIHWPSSARTGTIMVKELEAQPMGGTWLVLDMDALAQVGSEDDCTEEHEVLAATAIGARALRASLSVGLLAYGDRRVCLHPARGEGQLWLFLRELATLRAAGSWSLDRVCQAEKALLSRGVGVIIIATSLSRGLLPAVECVRQAVRSLTVVLVDAQSFGAALGVEEVVRQLHAMGVRCVVVGKGQITWPRSRWERLRLVRGRRRWSVAAAAPNPSEAAPGREREIWAQSR